MLSKTLVPLAFGQGLDTKKDKKQQVFGTLRIAENVVFETLGSARKRNGYDSIQLLTTTNDSIGIANFLSGFKNELLVFNQTNLFGYSSSLQKLEDRGTVYSVFPTTWPVANTGYNSTQVDMAVNNTIKIFTYTNASTNKVHYSVQDAESQTMLVTDAQVTLNSPLTPSTGSHPRVAILNNKFFIFFVSGTKLYYRSGYVASPSAFIDDIPIEITGNVNSTKIFDIAAIDTENNKKIIITYSTNDLLNNIAIISITYAGILSNIRLINETNSITAIDLEFDSITKITFATYATTTSIKYFALRVDGSLVPDFYPGNVITPKTAAILGGGESAVSLNSCKIQDNSYNIYYTLSAATAYNYLIKSVDVTFSAAGTPSLFLRSVSLASKPFTINNQYYFLVAYDSAVQGTYFVVDTHGAVVSKINSGVAGGRINANVLPHTFSTSTYAIVPTLYRAKFVAENGDFFSLNGVSNTKLDFSNSNSYQNTVLGNNMIIGGGIVQMYDGQTVVEHGFNVFPEAPILTALTTGTANNNGGVLAMANSASALDTYGYCAVYKWTDHQGQEHRSVPSDIVNIHLDSGASQIGVQVVAPTLRLTQKENVTIEIYRTELNDTIFYLANTVTIPLINSTTTDTVTFIDGIPDDKLISGRALYTTGGILDNTPAPSARIVATHTASQRIFLAGLENENVLQYSKIVFPNQPVEFNDALTIPVDPIGGPITALASMDEKVIIFEKDAIFFLSGTGPNNAGQQDSFTTPERISTDVGCLDPKSLVLTPEGLMFKSRKGIYLLSRALQINYIGAPVEAYNNLTITSAKVVGELNQVRFTTIDGDTLVYNYVFNFWATFTNHIAKSAEVIGNDYYYLRYNGLGTTPVTELYKENRTNYSDAGTTIKMRLEIGWISFTVLQGFTRLYKMLILGDWYSKHNLKVRVAYDFKDVYLQSTTIDPEIAQIDATAYGIDSPYGEPIGKPYGGYGNPYQIRVNFKQQKCQSVKLLIEDEQADAGQGFSLSQITFEVGGKSGLFKVPKGKKFAMS